MYSFLMRIYSFRAMSRGHWMRYLTRVKDFLPLFRLSSRFRAVGKTQTFLSQRRRVRRGETRQSFGVNPWPESLSLRDSASLESAANGREKALILHLMLF